MYLILRHKKYMYFSLTAIHGHFECTRTIRLLQYPPGICALIISTLKRAIFIMLIMFLLYTQINGTKKIF